MIKKRTRRERVVQRAATFIMALIGGITCAALVAAAGAPTWGSLAVLLIVGICFQVPLWVREELED